MLIRKRKIQEQLKQIEAKIHSLPEGKLVVCKDSAHAKYYQSYGQDRVYIPKAKRILAEQLAAKRYLILLKQDLQNELKAIDSYLNFHSAKEIESSKFLLRIPEFSQSIISKYVSEKNTQISSINIEKWAEEKYEQNKSRSENLIYKSISGNTVRSKSECLIDMNLYLKGIPFRYECALELECAIYYPDFTILHPTTGEIFYWEHFGMMDNNEYINNAMSKLKKYCENGIIPGINLIITCETKDNPLDMQYVEQMITYFFGTSEV